MKNKEMKKLSEIEKLNGICFWLIQRAVEANAVFMNIGQDNVSHKGEDWGSWTIIVNRTKAPRRLRGKKRNQKQRTLLAP